MRKHKYLETCQARFQNYGSTYKSIMLGSTVINTCEPQNIQAILATQFTDFQLGARRNTAFEPLLGHGIFASDGETWSGARRVLKPAFSKDNTDYHNMLGKHVSNLFEAIDGHQRTSADGAVDIQKLFFRLTLDVASEMFFGASTVSLRAEPDDVSCNAFAEAFEVTQRWIAKRFVLGPFSFLQPNGGFNEARKVLSDQLDLHVDRVLQMMKKQDSHNNEAGQSSPAVRNSQNGDVSQKQCYVVLEELARHTSDPTSLEHHLLNLLVAARDTTASLLSNMWHVLAQRPDIWEKLEAEVLTVRSAPEPMNLASLKGMPYLQACIKECRLLQLLGS